jgi:hypothetical protein
MQTNNTLDATNEYLAKHQDKRGCTVKRIICADGFDMSVQASKYHYCAPRTDTGPYHKVEIGFPSAPVAEFMEYQDGDDDVYGYVPVEIVNAVIAAHGGIKE